MVAKARFVNREARALETTLQNATSGIHFLKCKGIPWRRTRESNHPLFDGGMKVEYAAQGLVVDVHSIIH